MSNLRKQLANKAITKRFMIMSDYKNKIKSEQIPCAESVAKNGCVCELQACYMSCSSWYRSHNLLAERVKRLITGEEALETLTQLNACENILRQVKQTELQEAAHSHGPQWLLMNCALMKEAVKVKTVYLQTEKSPVPELQATYKTKRGGSDVGREQCHVNIPKGKMLVICSCLQCSQYNSTVVQQKCAEGGCQFQFSLYINYTRENNHLKTKPCAFRTQSVVFLLFSVINLPVRFFILQWSEMK